MTNLYELALPVCLKPQLFGPEYSSCLPVFMRSGAAVRVSGTVTPSWLTSTVLATASGMTSVSRSVSIGAAAGFVAAPTCRAAICAANGAIAAATALAIRSSKLVSTIVAAGRTGDEPAGESVGACRVGPCGSTWPFRASGRGGKLAEYEALALSRLPALSDSSNLRWALLVLLDDCEPGLMLHNPCRRS